MGGKPKPEQWVVEQEGDCDSCDATGVPVVGFPLVAHVRICEECLEEAIEALEEHSG